MFLLDARLSLFEINQNFDFGVTIADGYSYLEYLFRLFEVFKLHEILYDAAGSLPVHSGKGTGYCYMIRPGPNFYWLVYATGLHFCLHIKLFTPSIFNSGYFRSNMSGCIITVYWAGRWKYCQRFGSFLLTGMFRETLFTLQKDTTPQNTFFGVQEICMKLCGTVEIWFTVSSKNFSVKM